MQQPSCRLSGRNFFREHKSGSKAPALHISGSSRDLLPEGGFAGGNEGVLARVPAEKMWGARVRGVMLAACPDLVEQKCTGLISGTV